MDCVTQSASPLGHNLKNDLRKGCCVTQTLDYPQTFECVILRATPEESHSEPFLQHQLSYKKATRMPGDHEGLPYGFTYLFYAQLAANRQPLFFSLKTFKKTLYICCQK